MYFNPGLYAHHINTFFMYCRVLQDRHEQARQDLKGLEETVVSYIHVYSKCCNGRGLEDPNTGDWEAGADIALQVIQRNTPKQLHQGQRELDREQEHWSTTRDRLAEKAGKTQQCTLTGMNNQERWEYRKSNLDMIHNRHFWNHTIPTALTM